MGSKTIFVFSLLLIVSVLSMPAAAATPDEKAAIERGAVLVESRCTFCHTKESLPKLVQRCASRQGSEYLHKFLERHYAPDDQERADIIAFLTCDPAELQDK